jgi:hypothetical protein
MSLTRVIMMCAGLLPKVGLCYGSDLMAEVLNPVATVGGLAEDPEVAVLNLRFSVRVTNQAGQVVRLPELRGAGAEITGLVILAIETKRPGSVWAPLMQVTWVEVPGTMRYAPCRALSPDRSVEFAGLWKSILLLRKQVKDLGGEAVVRLTLMLPCQEASGPGLRRTVTTEPFHLRLPGR